MNYWTNLWKAVVHVKKNLTKIFSPNCYASFGTLVVKICQLSDPQWVLEGLWKFDICVSFASKTVKYQFSWALQRLTEGRIISQLFQGGEGRRKEECEFTKMRRPHKYRFSGQIPPSPLPHHPPALPTYGPIGNQFALRRYQKKRKY